MYRKNLILCITIVCGREILSRFSLMFWNAHNRFDFVFLYFFTGKLKTHKNNNLFVLLFVADWERAGQDDENQFSELSTWFRAFKRIILHFRENLFGLNIRIADKISKKSILINGNANLILLKSLMIFDNGAMHEFNSFNYSTDLIDLPLACCLRILLYMSP